MERLDETEGRRLAVDAAEAMVGNLDNLHPGEHRRDHARQIVAVGVVAMIGKNELGKSIPDGCHHFRNALGGTYGRVVLEAEHNLIAHGRHHLFHFGHIKVIGVVDAGGEAKAGHQKPARLLHFLGHHHQVRDMIHEIVDPPDIDVGCK